MFWAFFIPCLTDFEAGLRSSFVSFGNFFSPNGCYFDALKGWLDPGKMYTPQIVVQFDVAVRSY